MDDDFDPALENGTGPDKLSNFVPRPFKAPKWCALFSGSSIIAIRRHMDRQGGFG